MRKLIALALVAAAAPMFADDGNSATASATATVTIYAPVTLLADQTPFDLGKLVILNMNQAASVTFGHGAIQSMDNCTEFHGQNSASVAATFPTFTLTKDANLGVSFTTESTDPTHLTLDPLTPVTDSSTTYTFQLAGTWTFAEAGNKTATITVTASYI